MENFKPESKPKQESAECKNLRRKLLKEFHPDKLRKFSSELQEKGSELVKKISQLHADANNGAGGDLFEKLKAIDQEKETADCRAQIKLEESKAKTKERMRVHKDAQAAKKKAKTTSKTTTAPGTEKQPEPEPEPNKTQADNENTGNTENTSPEESADTKQPEPEPEPEKAFKMGEADAETETETETKSEPKEEQANDQEQENQEPEPEEESENNPEQEQNEELEKMEKAVEQARDQFVRINTEVTSAYLRIKRTLGKVFSKEPQNVPDVENSYLAYQEKTRELKNFKLDAIKNKYAGMSALSEEEKTIKTDELKKELGDLMLEFNFEEKINLYNARTTAGAEVRKDQLGGKALAKSAEWVNRYRKLNWKYKLAISGVLLAGGVGAAMVGATGVGVGIAAINIGKRVIGGAAAGMGTAGLMEAIAREKQKKQAEKNKKAIFDEFDAIDTEHKEAGFVDEDANWEEKLSALEQKLNSEIDEYAQSLKNEKGSVELRALAGLGVGVFVGSGLAGQVFKYGFGLIKDTSGYGIVKEACGNLAKKFVAVLGVTDPLNIDHSSIAPESGTTKITPENITTEKPIATSAPVAPESGAQKPDSTKIVADQEKVVPVNVKAHSSFSSSVDGDLRLHPDEVPTHAGASDGGRFYSSEVNSKVSGDAFEINKGKGIGNIERGLIRKAMADLGISKKEAGTLASQMTKNYLDNHPGEDPNLVHDGDIIKKVDFKNKIYDLDRASSIKGGVHNTSTVHEPKLPENHAKIKVPTEVEHKTIKVPNVEAKIVPPLEPEHVPQEKIQRPEINQIKNSDIPPGNIKEGAYTTKDIERMNADLQNNPAKLSGHESSIIMARENSIEIARTFGSDFVGSNILANQLLEIKEMQGDDFYRMYVKIMNNLFKSVVKEGGLGSIRDLGGMDAGEYIENGNNSKVIELVKYCKKIGYNFNPKNNENMGMWTERVLKEVMRSCGAASPKA